MMIGNDKSVNGACRGARERRSCACEKKAGLERARLKVLAT
jgi:hypothetical protein